MSGQPASLIQEQRVIGDRAWRAAGLATPPQGALRAMAFGDDVDVERMRQALASVVAAVPVLRTVVGSPTLEPLDAMPPAPVSEVGGDDRDAVASAVRDAAAEILAARAPGEGLTSVDARFLVSPRRAFLVAFLDHWAFDAWSASTLFGLVTAAYAGELPDVPDYLEWARAEREWADSPAGVESVERWRTVGEDTFDDLFFLDAPWRSSPPALPHAEPVAQHGATVSAETTDAIRAHCAARRVTMHAYLLACVQTWLARRDDRTRFITVTPFHNRTHRDARQLIGWCTNKLPILADLTDGSFPDAVARAHRELAAANGLQRQPFVRWCRRWLADEERPFRRPDFVYVSFFSARMRGVAATPSVARAAMTDLKVSFANVSPVGLSVRLEERPDGLDVTLYRPLDGLHDDTLREWAESLARVITERAG